MALIESVLSEVDSSWQDTLRHALTALPEAYRDYLMRAEDYIPDRAHFLNAFTTLPQDRVRYILFGQDPYPRAQSASGYAFIDGAVASLFSDTGLDKAVNRATSLRNFVKMALVSSGRLSDSDTGQSAIRDLDKSDLIDSMDALRKNFESNGVLLLNSSLIFTDKPSSKKHIKIWQGFIETLLEHMAAQRPVLILFGSYAKALKKLSGIERFEIIEMEHPYNHTFIANPKAHKLFGPMRILEKN